MSPDKLCTYIYNGNFRNLVNANEKTCINVDITKVHENIRKPRELHSPEDIWIFGYGSLMWKIGFPCIDWQQGYICGYLRRFYQHSIDHRGVYQKPGRVVTLIPASEMDRVYGVAYRVQAKERDNVLKHLDFREKNGYERCTVKFHVSDENGIESECFDIVIYIATAENESWAGDGKSSQIENIAQQICTSVGPSGRNRDYLFCLVKTMQHLFPGVHDVHLWELNEAVLRFINEQESNKLEVAIKKEIEKIVNTAEVKNQVLHREYLKLEALFEFCKKSGWKEYFLAKYMYGIDIGDLWRDDK